MKEKHSALLPTLALAFGTFGIAVTEFSPMGILPLIATGLNVSIPTAGFLVTAYAVGVVIGAPLMTLTTARMPRRALLIFLMIIFTAGNILAASSDGYGMLLAARILTSLSHGAFQGIGAVVAASIAPEGRRAGAVATVLMGVTLANVGGVPLATCAGELLGWRAVFIGIGAMGLITILLLWMVLPDAPAKKNVDMTAELRVLKRRPVIVALAITVVGSSAMFTVFTYISPILQNYTHETSLFVSIALVIYGIGLTIGNWLGGHFADKSVDATILTALSALTVLLMLFAWAMRWPSPAAVLIFLWGVATFALVPPLQLRVMMNAGDAPNLASAMNIGAFNFGNAIGATLGGTVLNWGFGYPAVSLAGAVMAGAGFVMTLVFRSGEANASTERRA
ncbi:MFS transporter [Komagataeibacter europaeus]|uniref:MFS transporter n=1 Tax=Komagataeibacter europaeus TaxID=33995 RepID=UPI000B3E74CE|nr:MFS transporter [Komagataeibacter europaeus]ARW15980.1 Inner membrane transport protein YdhP [Komagataeibacter europaeus]